MKVFDKSTIIVIFIALLSFNSISHLAAAAKTKPCLCNLPHAVDGYNDPEPWRCHGLLPLWSYNKDLNECVLFHYGGCGGNENSFYSREDCETTCKS